MNNSELMQIFSDAVQEMSSGVYTFVAPPVFVESTNKIDGVKSEYYADGSKIQFHFWGDPVFPEKLGDALVRALRAFPPDDVVVEYVPEVDSWYTHVSNLPLGASAELAERLIRKTAEALQDGQ